MGKPASATRFSANEKVLCHHQGMIYEAKIMEVDTDSDNAAGGHPMYKVHYQGWNNRWDEWVTEDRLLDINEENLKMQSEVNGSKAGGKTSNQRKSGAGESSGTSTPGGKPKSTGGKSRQGTESGPSTPFDGSMRSGIVGEGGGLEMESRGSSPSVDGAASVNSNSTTGQFSIVQSGSTKRKRSGKQKGDNVANTPDIDAQGAGDTADKPSTTRKRRSQPALGNNNKSGSMQVTDDGSPTVAVESLEQFRNRQEIKINLDDDLKGLIVDDWDMVTRQHKLYTPPVNRNIDTILEDYVKYTAQNLKRTNKNAGTLTVQQAKETVEGIREYFNGMVGVHLLYSYERPQYNEILAKEEDKAKNTAEQGASSGMSFTSYYGFPHLLRLFVKLGQMLAYTDLNQKEIDIILVWVKDFLAYLHKTRQAYYKPEDYETGSPAYFRKALA